MPNFLKNKYLFILFGFLIAGFLTAFSFASALKVSQIYFIEFNIEKGTYNAGEDVRGNFTIWNYEDSVVPDVNYRFLLFGKDENGYFDILMDDQPSGQNFSFYSGEKSKINFIYGLPQNLPAGEYELKVKFFNSKGRPMAWESASIKISNEEGKFLFLKNPLFLKNGENFSVDSGVSYSPLQTPQIVFDISNPSPVVIEARPEIIIYEYNVSENSVQDIKEDYVVVKSGKSQNVKYDLISLAKAGFYVARVKMFDRENNLISNPLDFYWEIPGKEAEIVQMTTDKTSYEAGETATSSVDIVVPEGSGKKADLVVTITASDGTVVGEARREIDLKTGNFDIAATTSQKVSDPIIKTSIISKENGEVDQYEVKIKTEKPKEAPPESAPFDWKFIGELIALFSAMIVILYFYKKNGKRTFGGFNGIVFLFLMVGGLLFYRATPVLAWEEFKSGPDGNEVLTWTQPLPLNIYEVGGYLTFKGSVNLDPQRFLKNNEIKFFIGDLNDPVLKDNGAIKEIDLDNSPNIVKFREEFSKSGSVREVDYEKVVHIPSNLLSYVGDARFYIQYKGYDEAKNKWHWYIAYQKVLIQKTEEGGLFINLTSDKNNADTGEFVTYKIEAANKSPCARGKLDVAEVLDRSGSMGGSKITDAKSAAKNFIDVMDNNYDRIGLVSYSTVSTLDSSLTDDFSSLKTLISGLSAGGNTCISCAIKDANQEIINNGRPDAAAYEVLMTDGLTNTTIGGSISLVAAYNETKDYALKAKENGIIIYTVGFGDNADGDLLNEIASITGGTYSYAPTGERLKEIFEAIAGTLRGRSDGTKITIDVPEGLEVIDYPGCTLKGSVLTCDVGDLNCYQNEPKPIKKFEIKTKITSDEDESIIKVEAIISNDASKEKKSNSVSVVISGNKVPEKPDPVTENVEHCAFGAMSQAAKGTLITFNWRYFDRDGDPQTAYEIWLDDNSDFLNKKFNLTVSHPPNPGPNFSYVLDLSRDEELDWLDELKWNKTYYWKVRVWDNVKPSPSDWSNVASFEMPKHSYPQPDFNWTPKKPAALEVVIFNNKSKSFGGAKITDYLWTVTEGIYIFGDGTNMTSVSPHIKFGKGSNKIKLGITDDDGYSCESNERLIYINLDNPKWIEIPPFSP